MTASWRGARLRRLWAELRGVLTGSCALVSLSVASSPASEVNDVHILPENPIDGRLLFEAKHCNQCHGLVGAGPDIGPELGGGHFSGSFLELGAALWNHVPGMSVAFEDLEIPWPTLSADETSRLIAFLYYIDYLGEPGVPAEGRRVFVTRGCVSCHRIGDEGREIGPDLTDLDRFASPLYIAQSIWNHGPAMFESMRERRVSPPRFEPGDLANLSAYIRGVRAEISQKPLLLVPGNPALGRDYFDSKGCGRCHSAAAGAEGDAPNLHDQELPRSAEAIAGTMWNHAMAMNDVMKERQIAWPHFTTQELADLTSYLYFLPFADPQGEPARGARIFTERSCGECHSPNADPAHPGPELTGANVTGSAATLVSAMWNHAPVMKEAVLSEGRPWPELSGKDLRDLLVYLRQAAASP